MKILVLCVSKGYEIERILEKGKSKSIEIELLDYKDIDLSVGLEQLERKIGESIGVVSRIDYSEGSGQAIELRDELLKKVVGLKDKMINGRSYLRYPKLSKLDQAKMLQKEGVSIPKTVFAERGEKMLEFPFVVKGLWGSNGEKVFLVKTEQEFRQAKDRLGEGGFLMQELLPNKEDYRVLVLGGGLLGMMKRKSRGSFLTNVAQGGDVERVEEHRRGELERIALKTKEIFECDFAGIDIMYDNSGKPCVLEINRGAGYRGFEQITGVDVTDQIIKYFESKGEENGRS